MQQKIGALFAFGQGCADLGLEALRNCENLKNN